MTRSKFSTKAVLLATAIGLSTAAIAGSQPAAAQSYSGEYACPAGTVYDPTYGCTTAGADDFGYYDYPGGTVLYGRHGLLWGFAPQFKLIPKWDWGGLCSINPPPGTSSRRPCRSKPNRRESSCWRPS